MSVKGYVSQLCFPSLSIAQTDKDDCTCLMAGLSPVHIDSAVSLISRDYLGLRFHGYRKDMI